MARALLSIAAETLAAGWRCIPIEPTTPSEPPLPPELVASTDGIAPPEAISEDVAAREPPPTPLPPPSPSRTVKQPSLPLLLKLPPPSL